MGSCLPFDNSSEAAKTESAQGIGNNYFNSIPPNQHSNGSNNNNDMGSTTSNNAFTKPNSEAIDKPKHKSAIKYLQPSSAFQPLQNVSPQPVVAQGKLLLAHTQLNQNYMSERAKKGFTKLNFSKVRALVYSFKIRLWPCFKKQ